MSLPQRAMWAGAFALAFVHGAEASGADSPSHAPSRIDAPADPLAQARLLAASDRPAARRLVEGLLARGDADAALAWDATLWLASDLERWRSDPIGALALTEPLWAQVLVDAVAGDDARAQRRLETRTADVHSRILAKLGRSDEARAVGQELARRDRARTGTPESAVEPGPAPVIFDRAEQGQVAQRRSRLRLASWVTLAAFLGLGTPFALGGLRHRPRPYPVGAPLVGAFALGAAGIGALWDGRSGAAGGWMALGFVAVHVVAAFALLGAGSRRVRVTLRVLAVLATLAAAYLALDADGLLMQVGL